MDTGLSASLMSYEAGCHLQRILLGKIKKSAKTEWNTHAGNFQPVAIIIAENLSLPHFTTKQIFQITFLILWKQSNPSFRVIIGCNIQQQLELNNLNSTKQLQWTDILTPVVA